MLLPLLVFFFVTACVLGGFFAMTHMPGMLAARQLDRRLREVSDDVASADPDSDDSVVKRASGGPLPGVDRLIARTGAGLSLGRLIDQSGVRTTPSAIVVSSFIAAVAVGAAVWLFAGQQPVLAMAGALFAAFVPIGFLLRKKSVRMKRFEEQFPEALDLLSRAIRAGHALQTALGMVADELKEPVGPEFKKTF